MILRPATADDVHEILRMRREVAEWIRTAKHSDQWSRRRSLAALRRRLARWVEAGETWMVDDDGSPVGTMTVNSFTGKRLWAPEETDSALFCHSMMTDRSLAGQGIGVELLDFACQLAQRRGKPWLRIDAWTTNTSLHRYYLRHGFRHVRTMPERRTGSAALFERPSEVRTGTGMFTLDSWVAG
ncbi:GNAT family N-acetyltransferase [Kutzneria sp. CA-103260]|uniref:GNAT family N-acetyltransferase n=1 Tax=Kutzneria sp. CA-103260 TaxID=2802641 RepID=UPI001BA7C466|nr:GNAT family N-acetyltransferase [Kutzneria sp. CA-103260]QUQ64154.1 GNAT family N-acetyltransferase [Kutzneria sp. CA-103260]